MKTKPKCRSCGGAVVSGIDAHRICPECLRLERFMTDVKGERFRQDQHAIGEGNTRRLAEFTD